MGQREVVPGGWTVAGEFHGWRFRLEPAPGGVRVYGFTGQGAPAVCSVPA